MEKTRITLYQKFNLFDSIYLCEYNFHFFLCEKVKLNLFFAEKMLIF